VKVVVTGAGGFIGSRVCDYLGKAGHVVVTNTTDLLADQTLSQPWQGADAVIHCAGLVGGIAMNIERPADMMGMNTHFILNALSLAYRSGVKRFVNLGSVCAYPDVRGMNAAMKPAMLWDGRPESPNAPYGIAKRMGIEMVNAYRAQYGMIGNNIILSNVYGPGVRGKTSSHVIPALVERFLEANESGAREVVVWGNGNAVREFLFVDDAARAIVELGLKHNLERPINVGSGHVVSIRELVDLLQRLTGFTGSIVWDAMRPDSRTARLLDSHEAHDLGFQPSVNLEEGLQKTIEWVANERNRRTPAAV